MTIERSHGMAGRPAPLPGPFATALFVALAVFGAQGCATSNVDDIQAGIVVEAPDDLRTTESGQTVVLRFRLNSAPSSDVTIPVMSSDPTEGAIIGGQSYTFNSTNWNAPQFVIVEGVPDGVPDGDQEYVIHFGPSVSEDPNFQGLEATSPTLVNVDMDSAGLFVSNVMGAISSDGDEASFTVSLNTAPSADVVIELESERPDLGTISPSTLTFTEDNWNAAQTVTVTGVANPNVSGAQVVGIAFVSLTTDDPEYADITLPDPLIVDWFDETVPGFVIEGPSGPTTESGGQATFTVRLRNLPGADVTVALASSDPSEGTIDVSSLTFTPVNWAAPQTVTVTGVNDDVADGNQVYYVEFEPAVSDDPVYHGLVPPSVELINIDNDTAGISVTRGWGSGPGRTTEDGGTATFTVVLNAGPTATVTLPVMSSDPSEGVTNVSSLTFTPTNWSSPQTVTVTGVNDNVADGDQSYQIVFGSPTSSDANYAALTVPSIPMINEDNDSPGIIVSSVSGNTTEAGGQATFTIRLQSQPVSNVTVRFASNDTSEGTTNVTQLVFTSSNWNTNQTVTITGVDDYLVDGNQTYRVVFMSTQSSDSHYSGITPSFRELTNIDNESLNRVEVRSSSNRCLDLYDSSPAEGANIVQWQCHNDPNHEWIFAPLPGSDEYLILSNATQKCMVAASPANHANVEQATCNPGSALHRWRIASSPAGGQWRRIRVADGDRCLDVNNSSSSNGTNIKIHDPNNNAAQDWRLNHRGGVTIP